MRDGRTRKHNRDTGAGGPQEFLAGHEVKIFVVAGSAVGQSFPVDRDRIVLGRGPGVNLAFADPEMSRQHAVIEYSGEGFRLRDLGSTNGTLLNGKKVEAADIRHGDRFEMGSHGYQFVVEEREATPETYDLSVES